MMKLRSITPLLLATLTISSFAAGKSEVKKKKRKSKKNKIKISLAASIEGKLSENLDSLSDVENFNESALTRSIKADLAIKTKFKKIRFKSKTSFQNITLENDLYKDVETVNDSDLDERNRSTSLAQELSASYKVNKRLSLNSALEYKKTAGYSIVSELQILNDGSISQDKKYNLLDAKSDKVSATLGGRLKIHKKVSIFGVYKFNEFFNTDQYTFAGDQGTNDRRIHSAGSLIRWKATKRLKLSLNGQATQTEYKDRLTTLENGGFNQNGIVDRAKYLDTKLAIGAKLSILSLDIDQTQRQDQSGGGDGYISLGIKLGLKYNINKLSLSGNIRSSQRRFNTQVGTGESDKRLDEILNATANIGYKISKNFKIDGSISKSESDSNNIFGERDNESFGLKLSGNF